MKTKLTPAQFKQELSNHNKFHLKVYDVLSPLYLEAEFDAALQFGTYSPSLMLTGNGIKVCLYFIQEIVMSRTKKTTSFELTCMDAAGFAEGGIKKFTVTT